MNDIAFHPQHGTLATVGSDGKYSFWDKDARTKLKVSNGWLVYLEIIHVVRIQNFPKRTCACQEVRNVSFSKYFAYRGSK